MQEAGEEGTPGNDTALSSSLSNACLQQAPMPAREGIRSTYQGKYNPIQYRPPPQVLHSYPNQHIVTFTERFT